ncbi:MAG: hypothetical protein EZS28_028163, partial [Streblomastix strix]
LFWLSRLSYCNFCALIIISYSRTSVGSITHWMWILLHLPISTSPQADPDPDRTLVLYPISYRVHTKPLPDFTTSSSGHLLPFRCMGHLRPFSGYHNWLRLHMFTLCVISSFLLLYGLSLYPYRLGTKINSYHLRHRSLPAQQAALHHPHSASFENYRSLMTRQLQSTYCSPQSRKGFNLYFRGYDPQIRSVINN